MVSPSRELYAPEEEWKAFWTSFGASDAFRLDRQEILSEADRLRHAPIPELGYSLFVHLYRHGTRLEYEQAYFERRRMLNTFALLALWQPEREDYAAKLIEVLWAICGEVTWCVPAHVNEEQPLHAIDLFSAETGFTFAELLVLFGDRLPPLVRSYMQHLVRERLFVPFLTHGPYHWESMENNWSSVCGGSIGSAALLLLEDGDELDAILKKVEGCMDTYLGSFGEDGACREGIGYWNYGFGYFTFYADLLRRRSGGSRDLFRAEKIGRIAEFQQKIYLSGSAVANFSDSHAHVRAHLGLSRYLAAEYPGVQAPPDSLRADFREDHCSRWAHAFRNLFWRGRSAAGADWPSAGFFLEDAQWLVSRAASPLGICGFAAKGGHNDESHNHNDLGHFLLAGEGRPFLADLGSGEYTKSYFGPARYEIACTGSQGHSVPILNGRLQAAGPESIARVLEASVGPDNGEDRLVLELADAYPAGTVRSFTRRFVWSKGDLPQLAVSDRFQPDGEEPLAVTERFVTWIQPVPAGRGRYLLNDGGRLAVEIRFDPAAFVPEITERIHRGHGGRNESWYTLDFHSVPSGEPGESREAGEAEFRFRFCEANAAELEAELDADGGR